MKFQDFTNLYPLSKTLRFELQPIGKTKENIERKGFLFNDKQRAEDYKKVKRIIDEYHKKLIDESLASFTLQYENQGKKDSLMEYYECLKSEQASNNETFEKIQTNLRQQISKCLTRSEEYKRIDKKELFSQDLPQFVAEENLDLIKKFNGFATYFSGFHQNRQNMYSDEAKSTSIAYRIIHENLPKFIDNIDVFNKIKQIPEIADNLIQLYKDFEQYLNVGKIEEIFELSYFNYTLTQSQIEVYNAIIGGKSEGDIKIKGLNEYINIYNQTHKESRLPKFKVLYKQILSDREHISWLPEQFNDDNELLQAIKEYYDSIYNHLANLRVILETLDTYDLCGVFVRNDQQLTNISKRVSNDWSKIQSAITEDLKQVRRQKKKEDAETYEGELRKLYKKQGSFSIDYIYKIADLQINSYFTNLDAVNTEDLQQENIFARITNAYTEIRTLLEVPYPANKKLIQDKNDVAAIKVFLDTLLELLHFVKPLLGTGEESDKDNRFYGEFLPIWDQLNLLTPLYNKVRNYVTRKPYSVEKYKLNFESSHFLTGWNPDYETKAGLLFENEGKYYLAINDQQLTHKEISALLNIYDNKGARRIILDFQKPDCKNVPRLFIRSKGENYAPAVTEYELPIDSIIDIYDSKKYKVEYKKINPEEFRTSLHKLIDYFKLGFRAHSSYCHYDFKWKETTEYEDINSFYNDTIASCYQVKYEYVNWSQLMDYVEEGKLYLFQIYNKDFSEYSKGTPNMHTLYWKMLFDERNLADVVYQLNGGAELFYRERSIEYDRPTHPANIPIKNKNTHNHKNESCFKYDLIKNKRYTVDKFQFHVPITLNFKSRGRDNINAMVCDYLHSAEDTHVIGIDRGERNLLYLVVVNPQGKICEQISLNEICNFHNGNIYKTDYHHLLDKREKDRHNERQSWQTIEGIKELKEGYLSQVIHKISELMVKYNAIVVLEDLNSGFMRGRQKVEKSVYQKFEKMLIDKLNYLVDKKADPATPGGLLKAYQLTNKFDSFTKLGKQSGFLFYVPAWNTSKIDPATGFVNLLDLRYESEDKAKLLLSKFDSIRYNNDKDRFEFKVDYNKFTTKAADTRTKWTICTYGTRIETFRNPAKNSQWDSREVNLTAEFKDLFEGMDICGNLKEIIMQQNGKQFFERLLHLLRLTLQIRNSITGTDVDYIISPVANDRGEFFDSRNSDTTMPQDADANGAYNIARKGLMIIEQIKNSDTPQSIKFDLSNKRWLQFAQQEDKDVVYL